jgi:thiol-disulfide isomerase/thioredoxin
MQAALLWFLFLTPIDPPLDRPQPSTPDERYQALFEEWHTAWRGFVQASSEAKTEKDLEAVDNHPGRHPLAYTGGFMALAKAHPGTSAAEDSLVWVASHSMFGRETEAAKRLLIRDHVGSAELPPVFAFQVLTIGSEVTEPLLREALSRTPHREVRGMACYWLARHLMEKAEASRQVRRGGRLCVQLAGVVTEGWGPDVIDRLKRMDPAALDREAEMLFDRVVREYPDLPHNDKRRAPGTLGQVAAGYLRDLGELAVGKLAPEIVGDDLEGRRFRLSEYRGKVVVLDFGSHFYCGTCREMYPRERALVKNLEGRPFALVTIDADDDLEKLKAAWRVEENPWRCVWDGGWDGAINTAWNIQEYPTIYVLDHEGVIRYKASHDPGRELDLVVERLVKGLESAGK